MGGRGTYYCLFKSDIIFIDSDGEQTTDDALSSSSSYALCTHIMADSAFYTHAKNSSGGCTVKKYSCQKFFPILLTSQEIVYTKFYYFKT